VSAATKLLSGQPFEMLFSQVSNTDLQRWSPKSRILPKANNRVLSILRVREHTRLRKNWAPIINEIITAKLPAREMNVLLTMLMLCPDEHLNRKQLRARARVSFKDMKAALESLVRRHILFFDLLEISGGRSKEIWHIASPSFWKIEGFRNQSYKPGATDPSTWVPRRLATPPEDGRIDEYAKSFSGSYFKVPRYVSKIELCCSARRVWMYLASLRQTWHPTAEHIGKALDLSKPTVLSSLRLLEECSMVVFKDYRHTKFSPRLERSYHIVDPALWAFDNCSDLPAPPASILHNPENINYIRRSKKTGSATEGQVWKRQRVKNGNDTGLKLVTTEGKNRKPQTVKNGSTQGKVWNCTGSSLVAGTFPGSQTVCGFQEVPDSENIHNENIPNNNIPDLNQKAELMMVPRLSKARRIYKPNGGYSTDITHLVNDYVQEAFRDRKGNVYVYRLVVWISDFTERKAAAFGCVEKAFDETDAFCKFIDQRFSGYRISVRQESFNALEAAWEKEKLSVTSERSHDEVAIASTKESESQNPALECEKTARHSYSTETASQPPVLEILPSVPVEAEPVSQAAILGFESLPEARVPTEEKKPEDHLPTDPDRQQWLVARVYAKARKSQRETLDALWKKAPGRMLPMLRYFSKKEYCNQSLVDSAQAELDALGILRKADIPALPWLDSGELAPVVVAPAPSPKEPAAGDGTLPLNRDLLKRALRRLLAKHEPNFHLRFEIDARFMAIADDSLFHAEMCNKFGREAVEGVINGNH
jgi:hypothetical protein